MSSHLLQKEGLNSIKVFAAAVESAGEYKFDDGWGEVFSQLLLIFFLESGTVLSFL